MSEERKEKKGSITLDKHCCVEVQQDRKGNSRIHNLTSMSMGEPVLWLKKVGIRWGRGE